MSDQSDRVVFSSEAYNIVLAETFHADPKETGGILLGHFKNGVWLVIECIEPGPGSIFKDYYFEYDHAFVNYLARARARRYEQPLEVLGLWHRHPGSMDSFSRTDDGTNRAFARLSPRGALSALVNLDPDFRLTIYRFDETLNYTPVPYTVSDEEIPAAYLRKKYQDRIVPGRTGGGKPLTVSSEDSTANLRQKLEQIARPRKSKQQATVYAPASLAGSAGNLLLEGYRGENPLFFNITGVQSAENTSEWPVSGMSTNGCGLSGYFLGGDTLKIIPEKEKADTRTWMTEHASELIALLEKLFPGSNRYLAKGAVIGFAQNNGLEFLYFDGSGFSACLTEAYTLSLDVFSRNTGILETDMMKTRAAVISGCGSVGSYAALELARAGVGRFLLVDNDVISYANICRHQCGIPDVGRYKTEAVADRIRMINPEAEITTMNCILENVPAKVFEAICGPQAVIIGCADNREGDLYAAKIAASYKMPMVSVGFWERAFAGEIFFWIPGKDDQACYQCFVSALGDISGRASVNRRWYTSQEDLSKVRFMPGISVDITFITNIGVKVALDILNRDNQGYIPRLIDSLTQFTLIANTHKTEIGGPQAALFSYPLQVTTSVVVEKIPGCKLCGKTS